MTYRMEIGAVAIALGIDVVATDFVSLVQTQSASRSVKACKEKIHYLHMERLSNVAEELRSRRQ